MPSIKPSRFTGFPNPPTLQTPITQIDRINFRYPHGPRDAEAMFVDPKRKIFIMISKREEKVHLYGLPYPQSTNDLITATDFGELPSFGGGLANYVTGAAISPDGNEILVRTYTRCFTGSAMRGQIHSRCPAVWHPAFIGYPARATG